MSSSNQQPSPALRVQAIVHGVLLAGVTVLVAWFLIESPALLGVLDYRTLIGPTHVWWAPNVSDPELIHTHRPHAYQKGEARGGDAASAYEIPTADMSHFDWDVHYDAHGFRNPTDLSRADIAVLGDSFVEGLTVHQPDLTSSLLAESEGETVANLGQSAWGPNQELAVLRRYALPLHPRTVLWLFFEGNDLGDVINYHKATQSQPSYWQGFLARSFSRSAYEEIKQLLHHTKRVPGSARSGIFREANGISRRVYFLYPTRPLSPAEQGAFRETVQIIGTAQRMAAAQGARLIFVYVPAKFRVFHDYVKFPPSSECGNWPLNDLPQQMHQALVATTPATGFLDLTPALEAAAAAGELPYYPDDEHWTPLGHKVAADAIHAYLTSLAGRVGSAH